MQVLLDQVSSLYFSRGWMWRRGEERNIVSALRLIAVLQQPGMICDGISLR